MAGRCVLRNLLLVGAAPLLALISATPVAAQAGSVPAGAPAPPRVEIFAGYSFLPEVDAALKPTMEDGHGFALALDLNFGRRIGLRADFDVHFWERRPERAPDVLGGFELTAENITLYFYSVGPRFVQRWHRVNVFGDVLLEGQTSKWGGYSHVIPGVADGAGNVPCVIGGQPSMVLPCVVPGHTSGAVGLGVGGGVDARIRGHFSIRILQINYMLGGFGSGPDRGLRLKAGVVFAFD